MNVPAVAKKTFEELKLQPEYKSIFEFVIQSLKNITNRTLRAKFVHKAIDDYNEEVFAHPLVKQFSPCTVGCTGCCHTQVSITEDEAELLLNRINDGVKINYENLRIQMKAENDADAFYKIKFEERKCIFLSDEGACNVYEDRPSVCRTNAVLGSKDQCDTRNGVQSTRLIRTQKSDVVIYSSFLYANESGTLPYMISKLLRK